MKTNLKLLGAVLGSIFAVTGAAASSMDERFTISVEGTLSGSGLLSHIAPHTPFSLSITGLLNGYQSSEDAGTNKAYYFWSPTPDANTHLTLIVAGQTLVSYNYSFVVDNNVDYIDWPVDGFSASSSDAMRIGNLYANQFRVTFSTTMDSLLTQGTLSELVYSSVTASTFDQVASLHLMAFENSNGTGATGTLVEQTITSVSFQVSAIPEPASFSALAGIVVASLALSGRRRRRHSALIWSSNLSATCGESQYRGAIGARMARVSGSSAWDDTTHPHIASAAHPPRMV